MIKITYPVKPAQKINNYNPIDEILDAIDIKYIETYIRKKKIKNLETKDGKL
jgi:hypothetical protein